MQAVQSLPDVHASQLAGQLTQLPPTEAVLGGHESTVHLKDRQSCMMPSGFETYLPASHGNLVCWAAVG